MAFSQNQTYPYNAWSVMERPDGSYYWHHERWIDGGSSTFGPSAFLPGQPIARYLQEPDRPFFTSARYVDDPVVMHPFPSVSSGVLNHIPSDGSLYSSSARYPSPSNGGLSSSHVSSPWSDNPPTPWSSPDMRTAPYTGEASLGGSVYGLESLGDDTDQKRAYINHCVTLHDVQQYPDSQPEIVAFDDEHASYGSYAQEGYQPIHVPEYSRHNTPIAQSQRVTEEASYASPGDGREEPILRRRRTQTIRSTTSPRTPNKIAKRSGSGRRSTSRQHKANSTASAKNQSGSNKSFPCPLTTYGCQSTFQSKNEWKRHVYTQHLRLGFWRCDQCPQGQRKPNDFNRKDLFIQHVRRMHPFAVDSPTKKPTSTTSTSPSTDKQNPKEKALLEISQCCYRRLRAPPEHSACLFCDVQFHGPGSWEQRMEHVGHHFEAVKKSGEGLLDPCDWLEDEATERWLVEEKLVVRAAQGRWVLADLVGRES